MNAFKVILLLFCCLALTAQAQSRAETAGKDRAETATRQATAETSTLKAVPARKVSRKPSAGQNSPDSISAAPGTVLTLCCGSLDPQSMAGSNCAYMHTGQGCGGFILACPEGTKDTVKEDGTGYCKEGG